MSASATFDGFDYRVTAGGPERRPVNARLYRPMRPRDLLALPIDGPAWIWLRAQGVRRPSPPGGRATTTQTPEAERGKQQKLLRLTTEEVADLEERARAAGLDVSRYVAREMRLAGGALKKK